MGQWQIVPRETAYVCGQDQAHQHASGQTVATDVTSVASSVTSTQVTSEEVIEGSSSEIVSGEVICNEVTEVCLYIFWPFSSIFLFISINRHVFCY